jgi:ribonuclease T2
MRLFCVLVAMWLIGCSTTPPDGSTKTAEPLSSAPDSKKPLPDVSAANTRRNPPKASRIENEADFDYYVLALSWSPEYCANQGRNDQFQCAGKRFAFVIHGLWPQLERGPLLANCSAGERVSSPEIEKLLPIMPSRRLIQYEWQKHGTCSGLRADEYAQRMREAYEAIAIPEVYQRPNQSQETTVAQLENAFIQVNPGLTNDSLAVTCEKRSDLEELRFCMSKDLQFRPCGRNVNDTCRAPIRVKPVR